MILCAAGLEEGEFRKRSELVAAGGLCLFFLLTTDIQQYARDAQPAPGDLPPCSPNQGPQQHLSIRGNIIIKVIHLNNRAPYYNLTSITHMNTYLLVPNNFFLIRVNCTLRYLCSLTFSLH